MHRHVPGVPLVVAANRDEFFNRPATAPSLWQHPNGKTILAPRDLHAGGTWLGLNSNGVFSALTNRPNPAPDETRRSRGLLVLDALGFATAGKAAAAFESLRSDQYNPFNLLVADSREAFAVVCHEGVVRVVKLDAGVDVIGNAEPNDHGHSKTSRVFADATAVSSLQGDRVLEGLADVCRSHDGTDIDTGQFAPLAATCVHHPGFEHQEGSQRSSNGNQVGNHIDTGEQTTGYGTRSSILLRLSEDPEQHELKHSEGAPCAHPYVDSTPLLHELSRMASYNGEGSITRKSS